MYSCGPGCNETRCTRSAARMSTGHSRELRLTLRVFDARLSRGASRAARKSKAAIPGGPLGGKTVHRTVFLIRLAPGAHPAGALRASNFVPDKIVRQMFISILFGQAVAQAGVSCLEFFQHRLRLAEVSFVRHFFQPRRRVVHVPGLEIGA